MAGSISGLERPRHRDDHRPAHAAGGGAADPAQGSAEHREVGAHRAPVAQHGRSPPSRPRPTTLAKPATWQAITGTVVQHRRHRHRGRRRAGPRRSPSPSLGHAATHQLGFANAAALGDQVVTGSASPLTVRRGRPTRCRSPATARCRASSTAINATTADTGVTRHRGPGRRRLPPAGGVDDHRRGLGLRPRRASTTALLGGATVAAGKDAEVTLGAVTATSATNTFTDLVPGVTLTIDRAAATRQHGDRHRRHRAAPRCRTASRPWSTSCNAMLTGLDAQDQAQRARWPATRASAPCAATLLETVFGDGTTSLASVGIQTDRYGKLVFDEKAFDRGVRRRPDRRRRPVHHRRPTASPPGSPRSPRPPATRSSGTLTTAITGRQTPSTGSRTASTTGTCGSSCARRR